MLSNLKTRSKIVSRKKAAKGKAFRNYPPDELAAIYAQAKREFTADDLQKYTVIEPGIPADQVLAEMVEIHRQYSGKRR
jgi:hypothetical protein